MYLCGCLASVLVTVTVIVAMSDRAYRPTTALARRWALGSDEWHMTLQVDAVVSLGPPLTAN